MDRKFIKENCRKCLESLDAFGLWCAYKITGDGKGLVMCTALEKCPYKEDYPILFSKGSHLQPSARKEDTHDSIDTD